MARQEVHCQALFDVKCSWYVHQNICIKLNIISNLSLPESILTFLIGIDKVSVFYYKVGNVIKQ